MSKYWSKHLKTIVIPGKHFDAESIPAEIVLLPDDSPMFSPLPAGMRIGVDNDMLPILVPVEVPAPEPTLEEYRAVRCKLICDKYVEHMNHPAVLGGYTQREIDTFHEQARESIMYSEAGTPVDADYPMLQQIAIQTSRTMAEQVNRVLTKRVAFNTFCGAMTGKRQALDDLLSEATTLSEIVDVDPSELDTLAAQLLSA